MHKTISIIIPYYKETPKEIFPILTSIHNQVGVDFSEIECILVNDGSDNILPESFLSLFTELNIICVHMEENKGPGIARQVGIDNASGDYVMFCDADDILHSVAVLGVFLEEIERYHPDIITSPWLEEIYDEPAKQYKYVNHEDEMTWMHGKLLRRIFLQTKNIRFHDELRIHEDSYFLALANDATNNKRKVMTASYVWRFIPTSITRRNNAAYSFESVPEFIKAIGYSFGKLEKNRSQALPYKVVQFIMYNYFTMHQSGWLLSENTGYREKAESAFSKMIAPYMHYYYNAPPDFIAGVYNQERLKLFGGHIESELLEIWLERIGLAKTNTA